MSPLTLLVIGDYTGRTKQRILAMRRLGHHVDVISASPDEFQPGINEHLTLISRIYHKLGIPKDTTQLNKRVLLQSQQKSYDIFWVEKSLVLKPKVLRMLKK